MMSVMIRMPSSLLAFAFFSLLTSKLFGVQLAPSSFDLLTTHPDASLQSTVRGQTISSLTHFQGEIYAAYGDWAADTGPMQIRGFHQQNGWSLPKLAIDSEAISHYRAFGDKLFTTIVDPLGPPGLNPGGFASGNSSHVWTANTSVAATHVFDLAETDNNVWLAGSQGKDAMVWRSTDGGVNFNVARQDSPALGAPEFAFSRYVGAASLNGELFLQRVDVNATHHSESLKFDGISWNLAPDMISQTNGYVFRPEQFGERLIYLDANIWDGDSSGFGNLYQFDGLSNGHITLTDRIFDFDVFGDKVYVLSRTGEILFSDDLIDWTSIGNAPTNARSLMLLTDSLLIGNTSGEIWTASYSGNVVAVPEAGTIALTSIGVCLGFFSWRRKRSLQVSTTPKLST